LVAAPSFAQDDAPPERPGIPVVGRPTSDFYNAAGTSVKLKAEATPRKVAQNEWLTLTLTITNLLNAADVEKPSLKALPEFAGFQIDDAKHLDPPLDAGKRDQRIFVYKLRPASTTIETIPEIAFHYYDPRRLVLPNRPQDKFPKVLSNAVPIHVTPPVAPPPAPATPLDVPAFALNLATGDKALSPSRSFFHGATWLPILFIAPLLAVGWVMLWKKIYPDSARLAQLRRNRSVRTALTALTAARRTGHDIAGQAADIMGRYLHERFDLPWHARTPAEIAGHLQSLGSTQQQVDLAISFFKDCDAARFAPTDAELPGLIDTAEQLIIALEAPA
jgi:hypothetical protein